jgi:hypothetical protein
MVFSIILDSSKLTPFNLKAAPEMRFAYLPTATPKHWGYLNNLPGYRNLEPRLSLPASIRHDETPDRRAESDDFRAYPMPVGDRISVNRAAV